MARIGIEIVVSRVNYLAVLISSLMRQTHKEWDLILVSERPVWNEHIVTVLLRRLQFEGHRIYTIVSEKRGIGKLRNEALNNNPNEIGCRIDDDNLVEPNYLELLLRGLKENENSGIVGGIVPLIAVEKNYLPLEFMPENLRVWDSFDIPYMTSYFYNDAKDFSVYKADHLTGSFIYYTKRAKEIGGYPTEYDNYAGFREESDFCIRMGMKYQNYFVPQAVCWHLASPTEGTRIGWHNVGEVGKWKAEEIYKKKMKKIEFENFEKKLDGG